MYLDDASLAKVRAVLRRHLPADTEVFVFGSRAHGRRLKPFSDLDLCLRGAHAIPSDVLQKLEAGFRESNLPIKVDVVDWQRIASEFRAAIASDLVLFPATAEAGSP